MLSTGPPRALSLPVLWHQPGFIEIICSHIHLSASAPAQWLLRPRTVAAPKPALLGMLSHHRAWHCLPHPIACDSPFSHPQTRTSRYLLASRGFTGPASCPAVRSAAGCRLECPLLHFGPQVVSQAPTGAAPHSYDCYVM